LAYQASVGAGDDADGARVEIEVLFRADGVVADAVSIHITQSTDAAT
jgi:hypothetical protein